MTKNQKIALGCGGVGCLGLMVVIAAGVVMYFVMGSSGRSYNFNSNSNRNSNSSRETNRNSSNSNDSNENSSASNDNSSSSSSSSMSDDDKHKLYQAASMTQDAELLRRVSVKLGLFAEDFTPKEEYIGFVKDHFSWALRNGDFIQSVNTKEKALAYVNEHFDN